MALAADFAAIFAGLDRVYGYYFVPSGAKPDEHGKILGKRATVTAPVTVELWERHLEGKDGFGIGIVPVRDDATCVFGAIDVDVYPLEHRELIAAVRRFGLPLTVCRSKSGGAHLYLFLSAPTSADLVRRRLGEFAVALGYPAAEVFPKQSRLAGPEDELSDSRGKGSWINVPYAGKFSTRYALKDDGTAMTATEFVAHARQAALSPADLAALRIATPDVAEADWFADGPPCLQVLAVRGFGDWQNNGLFAIAVYLKKRYGAVDMARLSAYNNRFMSPPLSLNETGWINKSTGKKTYSYKCKDQPICAACNREVCLTRTYGVGGRLSDPGVTLGPLVKLQTDPPTWIWEINAKRIQVSTKQLLNQTQLREIVLAELDVVMAVIPAGKWEALIKEKLEELERIEVPSDATPSGQLMVHLQRFTTSRIVGKNLDDLLRGVPYTDEEKGRTYFCSSDFLAYLAQHKFAGFDERSLYTVLRPRDLEVHKKKIKGKTLTYWSIPAMERQTEEFAVPDVQPKEERM